MTLTSGIKMPRGTNNATCHTHGPDTWHLDFFQIILKKFKKLKKSQTDTWHVVNSVS